MKPIRTAESLYYREARQRHLHRRASIALWACAALLALTLAAAAEPKCAPAALLSEGLASSWGETPFAAGVSGEAPHISAMILTVNPDTGTWTILESLPDGTACIRGSGTAFRAVPQGVES